MHVLVLRLSCSTHFQMYYRLGDIAVSSKHVRIVQDRTCTAVFSKFLGGIYNDLGFGETMKAVDNRAIFQMVLILQY